MRGYHRYNNRLGRRGGSFNGLIWMIGLAVLFFTGHWWPGILVLIVLSMIFSSIWRASPPRNFDDGRMDNQSVPPAAPIWTVPTTQPVAPAPPAPVSSAPRLDLLPSTCPRCGAPVRSNEIKWTGTHSANCSYCGSTLPMKNG
jgi:DNA-directed RNA polymerase subunit RPC12/RpoP